MWMAYQLTRDRIADLQAEGMAAQRVARVRGRRAHPRAASRLFRRAARLEVRPSRETASADEVRCVRAAAALVGRAA